MSDNNPGLLSTIRSSLINGIHEWSSARVGKANRISAETLRVGRTSLGAPHPTNFMAEKTAARLDAPLTTAVARLSDAILKVPLDLNELVEIDGKQSEEPAFDHPAYQLIQQPLPFDAKITMANIKQSWVQSLMRVGNSYTSLEEIKNGEPTEMWPLEPDKTYVDPNPRGTVNGYKYMVGAKAVNYKPDEIIHIKMFDIDSPNYGLSKTTSILKEIMTNNYAKEWNAGFFKKGAIPSGALVPDHDIDKEDQRRLRDDWNEIYGGQNQQNIGIMPFGFKFEQLSPAMKDLAFLEMLNFNRETIFGVHGLPPLYAGILKFANFANSKSQEKLFWMIAVMPLLTIIEDALNHQLLWQHYDPDRNYIFRFNYSGIEPLQSDRKEKMLVDVGYVRSAIKPINEVREEMKLPPVEWGDEKPAQSYSGISQSGEPGKPEPNEPPEKSAERLNIDTKGMTEKEIFEEIRCKTYYLRRDSLQTRVENGFKTIMKQFFARQSKRVVAGFRKYTAGRKTPIYFIMKGNDYPEEAAMMFDFKKEDRYLDDAVGSYYQASMKQSGDHALAEIGASFDVHDPQVLVTIDKLLNRIHDINKTTWNDIQRLLKHGYEEGDSLKEISDNIRKLFRNMAEYRADNIAATEMNGVTNSGDYLAYGQADVERIKWLAYLDSKVRPDHARAHGQVRNIMAGERFEVGGDLMKHPGDPDARALNVCRCRCTTIAVFKEIT
jgi:HK97 family phage portal protein